MSEADLNNGIIIGSNKDTEWMLPWWFERLREYNPNVHVSVHDYGLSEGMKQFLLNNDRGIKANSMASLDNLPEVYPWFLKPMSMLSSPFKKTMWLDCDTEICGDITDLFEMTIPEKLSMVQDMPWSKQFGTKMFNSGVVVFEGKPTILKRWCKAIETNPQRGDQETLHAIMDPLQQVMYIEDLPNKYNVVRLQLDPDGAHYVNVPDTRIKHWTGTKGKKIINQHLNAVNPKLLQKLKDASI